MCTMLLTVISAHAQIKVTGVVTDAKDGAPIPFASIVVKNSTTGTAAAATAAPATTAATISPMTATAEGREAASTASTRRTGGAQRPTGWTTVIRTRLPGAVPQAVTGGEARTTTGGTAAPPAEAQPPAGMMTTGAMMTAAAPAPGIGTDDSRTAAAESASCPSWHRLKAFCLRQLRHSATGHDAFWLPEPAQWSCSSIL